MTEAAGAGPRASGAEVTAPVGGAKAKAGRPTMNDVARAAGVSQSTVSFVLNDRRDIPVAAETRERILEAARSLGYRLNRRAQELRLNRSTTLGVVSYGVASHPFAGALLAGMQSAARAAGHVCMVIDVEGHDGDEAVADLLDRGVTGIVHASAGTGPVTVNRALGETRELFVGCWPESGGTGEGTVLPDDREGGRRAAAHLLDLGHRDIAFLGGPVHDFAAGEREAGLDDALRAASVDLTRVVRRHGDYGSRSGYRIANELFDAGRPTALICGNDQMALGALLALHERGLRVPDDVSLVGYDDQEALADAIHPALTTVRLPHREMGLRAAELLMKDPAGTPHAEMVDCPLVVRESTARPR